MAGDVDQDDKNLAISVAPMLDSSVEYFSAARIDLNITNLLSEKVLLEKITLCFQPDGGSAAVYVDVRPSISIPPTEIAPVSIEIQPTSEYLEYTNCFDIHVYYRIVSHLRKRLRADRERASYIIIRRPIKTIGTVFISFKQLEDLPLARMLELHAQRAGLNPYIVLNEPDPGRDQWNRIEEAIKGSAAAFVIWGNRTELGKGVQREVGLCRKYGVEEILLLDQNIEEPELFRGTQIEYVRFDPENPRPKFAEAVEATRRRFLKRDGLG